jgi:hypothetical protein
MRYTEKVYSSSLFACASLRKIPFYLEGQAAGLCCRLYLFLYDFARSAFVQPFGLSFSRLAYKAIKIADMFAVSCIFS